MPQRDVMVGQNWTTTDIEDDEIISNSGIPTVEQVRKYANEMTQ